ncbi:HlyD family efflux transporter periplasmic adaptor subunit [Roseimaritima sediminicola]|uniref:HlyD family efflux transporter periplasmic adaptor subunit n=1 Tax=Roseimaritima sediminicola TaxID=2662066 RepID=UPI0012985113|nr:HlyD family efflux transporter periplasmic adaptor subunit [Roseimaritima sediminicola]
MTTRKFSLLSLSRRRMFLLGGCLVAVLAEPLPAQHGAARPADERSVAVDECVIRYAEEVDVPATESGVLEAVLVKQNAAVQPSQVLASQDVSGLAVQLRIAQLQKQAAEEKLADDLELQYAHTALEEAQAELDSNRSVYDSAAGAVPLTLLRKLRLAVKRAELEVERERKQRRLAQVEIDLRTADLQLLQQRIERLNIKSPIGGVAVDVYKKTGEWITAGEPVARIARLDRLHAHCLMRAERLPPRQCVGRAVTATWTEGGVVRSLRGRVLSVDTELLNRDSYRLHAELPNVHQDGHWRLLPGTAVTLRIHDAAASPAASSPPAVP